MSEPNNISILAIYNLFNGSLWLQEYVHSENPGSKHPFSHFCLNSHLNLHLLLFRAHTNNLGIKPSAGARYTLHSSFKYLGTSKRRNKRIALQ